MGKPINDRYKPILYLENCLIEEDAQQVFNISQTLNFERHPDTPHLNNCFYRFDNLINLAIDLTASYYSMNVIDYKGLTVHSFTSGEKMGAHQDFAESYADPNDFAPTMSFVYYINDDYSGGEICFSPTIQIPEEPSNPTVEIKPTRNSCVLFDARWWHWVAPVKTGYRYSYAFFLNAI